MSISDAGFRCDHKKNTGIARTGARLHEIESRNFFPHRVSGKQRPPQNVRQVRLKGGIIADLPTALPPQAVILWRNSSDCAFKAAPSFIKTGTELRFERFGGPAGVASAWHQRRSRFLDDAPFTVDSPPVHGEMCMRFSISCVLL